MNTFAYIDHLLRNRESIIEDLKDESKVSQVSGTCFKVFVMLTVLYGAIMGAHSLIHGYTMGWKYIPASAIKLPLLFLLSLVVCLPLLYVLNVLIGPRQQFKAVMGIMMSSLAATSIMLAACVLILAFFMLSSNSYPFIVLLNVVIFTVAGLYGVWFLGKLMHGLSPTVEGTPGQQVGNVKTIINWWLFTYAIVGTQMAWMMRPFIGSPDMPFTIFRVQESDFYTNLFHLISRLLGG